MLIQDIIPPKKETKQNSPAQNLRRMNKKARNKLTPVLLVVLLIVQMFLPIQLLLNPPEIKTQEAKAAALTVCASGCDHTTIQAAINAAAEYDTIRVSAGTYTENVVINTQHLTLVGAGMHVTTIVASNSYNPAIRINANYTSVSGFAARGATGIAEEGTFYIHDADHCTVSHCMVDGKYIPSVTRDPVGIFLFSVRDIILEGNVIKKCHYGIIIDRIDYHNQRSIIKNNYIIDNTETGVHTRVLLDHVDVTCNLIRHNALYGWYENAATFDSTLANNSFIENGIDQGSGIRHYQFYDNGNSISVANNWWGTTDESDIAASIHNNTLYSPISSEENSCVRSHLYTDAANWWYNGKTHIASPTPIQSAIDNAPPHSTIHIGAGSYTENVVTRTDDIIIEGAGSSSVTLTAAAADSPVFQILHNDVSLSGITASGATAIAWGGTVYVENVSDVTIDDVVANNGVYGIHCESVSNITITNNIANGNTHDAIYVSGADITCNNNTANRNSGTGIYCDGNGNVNGNTTLANYTGISANGDINVYNNTAGLNSETGIVISSASNTMVTGNCVFQNSVSGMDVYGSNNVTVHDNYFSNTANNNGVANWYVPKAAGPNVVGGAFIGGNYWSDYTGTDTDSDGLGDTDLPHNGDMHPLIMADHTAANLSLKTNYPTISGAINAGNNNNVIVVAKGVYDECVDLGWMNAYILLGLNKSEVTVNSLAISSGSTVIGFTTLGYISIFDSAATNINIINIDTPVGSNSAFGGFSNSFAKNVVFGMLILYDSAANATFEDVTFNTNSGSKLYFCGSGVVDTEFNNVTILGAVTGTDASINISSGSGNTFTNTTFEQPENAIKISSGAGATFIQDNNRAFVGAVGQNIVDAEKSTLVVGDGTYDYRNFVITPDAEITIPETSLWETTGDQNKTWKVNATGNRTITFQFGDMLADTKYNMKVDDVKVSDATANSSGVITFPVYSGSFSEKTFTTEICSNVSPTSPTSTTQLKNDGSTVISNQGYTNETNIKLKASVTDADNPEIITLFFETALNSGSFNSPATPTTGGSCASGTLWGSCASKIWYVTSSSGDYSSTPYTGITNVAGLSDTTGYKWQVKACDDDNDCGDWIAYNATVPNFTIDTTAPTGSITNSSGNPTNDTTPTLDLSIADTGIGTTNAQMRFSCDNSSYSTWESYATPKTNFNIRTEAGCVDTDGTKTVYAQFRDSLENASNSYNTGSFILDTISSFATFDSGALLNPINQNTTDITVAGTDVTHYKYKLDNGSYGSETAVSVHLTLSDLTDGEHTIYLIGKDTAGNWQTEGSATEHTWTVDVTSPIVSLVSPSNNSSTGDSAPTLTWSGSDATSGIAKYQLYIDNSLDTDNISNTSTTPANNLICGSHTWYVKAIDNADNSTDSSVFNLTISCGNGLPSSASNQPIQPEPTPENPEGKFSVLINNDDEYTSNQTVTLKLFAGADTKRMAISNTEDFKCASQVSYQEEYQWNLFKDIHNSQFTIPDPKFTVYAKFYTQYGVVSEVVSDSIILKSTTAETEEQTDNPSQEESMDPIDSESSPGKTNPSGSSSFIFTKTLKLGSYETEVIHLQNKLKELNLFPKEIESNRNFGLTTDQAVMDYQTLKEIYPCGIVGPRTRKALNNQEFITNKDYKFTKDLKYSDKSEEVKQLQTRLRDQNFFPYYLQSSGWFGPTTQKAVNIFQKFYNLIQSGVVDEGMRGVLNR